MGEKGEGDGGRVRDVGPLRHMLRGALFGRQENEEREADTEGIVCEWKVRERKKSIYREKRVGRKERKGGGNWARLGTWVLREYRRIGNVRM